MVAVVGWTNYANLAKLSQVPIQEQVAMFESCLGLEALKVYNQITFDESKSLESIVTKMDKLLIGELNETYEWFCFNMRKQAPQESFDSFVSISGICLKPVDSANAWIALCYETEL